MNLLVDSNVILDMVQRREPFFRESKKGNRGMYQAEPFWLRNGALALRHLLHTPQGHARRAKAETGKHVLPVLHGHSRERFGLFRCHGKPRHGGLVEDGLQQQCANRLSLDFIVTRNVEDFEKSAVPAIEPGEFLLKHL